MIVIWGRYKSTKRYGHVADWCSRCASVRPIQLVSYGVRPHVYFVPLIPRSNLTGTLAECACGHTWSVDPDRYAQRLKKPEPDVNTLVAATFPTVAAEAERLLTFDQRRAQGRLTPEDRIDFMTRVISNLSPDFVSQRHKGGLDWRSGLGCLGTIGVFVLIVVVGKDYPALILPLILLALGAMVFSLYLLTTRNRRLYRRDTEPRLSALAHELGVTPEDETQIRLRLRRMRVPIAKAYRPVLSKAGPIASGVGPAPSSPPASIERVVWNDER